MARKPIFVDTFGFYAWADTKCSSHREAREIVHRRDRRFVTTAWIVAETINLFVARKQARWVEPILDFLETTRAVETLEPTWRQFTGAKDLWRKYQDQAFPLTDCTSFVVMRELDLQDALTADRHFRVMGFNPLLAD